MLIGAHYYAWYGKKEWYKNTLRRHVGQIPKAEGVFENEGWYCNRLGYPERLLEEEKTVSQHFEWCSNYGIDFLLVSFKREKILPYLDLAEKYNIKLTLHAETLGLVGKKKVEKEDLGKLLFLVPMIKEWMQHPAWLRIDGKPAIAYYVTRQISNSAIKEAISRMRDLYGDVFIFGDEVWWQTPNYERIELFDAVYAYNMYINRHQKMDGGRVCNNGATGREYLRFIESYEQKYYDVAQELGVKFCPTVLPGYNDRAVRYDVNHYPLPRKGGQFFEEYLEYSEKFLKDKILLVSSFNEWYEDSQIEPCIELCPQKEISTGERDLTNGVTYEPYEMKYLEILRDFKLKHCEGPLNIKVEKFLPEDLDVVQSLDSKELLDSCALLYYQTTILPILAADNYKKKDMQKMYFECTEEAQKRGITVKQIKARAKELTHYFSCNRSHLGNLGK